MSSSLTDLKKSVCDVIDSQRERLIAIGEAIWRNPEPGFQEVKTARLVCQTFSDFGLKHRDGLAVTGVRADLRGNEPGPTLALLGEMDALILPAHPDADPATGAVHACGHHAQIAGLLGAALGLRQSGVTRHLAGAIAFMAVPAEEYIQVEHRGRLAKEGKIMFLGGKQELIRLGCFDDVNLSMMIHTGIGKKASTRVSMNGFTAQAVHFKGRAAHAGSAPHRGVNALNAATLALQAVHAQRETFQDSDHVRVHPVITGGSPSVSIVPEDVRVETMIRASGIEAIRDAAKKARRCWHAGALAMGADVTVSSLPGYLPLLDCPAMAAVFTDNVKQFVGDEGMVAKGHLASSTDMGDVTQIMPASHPGMGGAEGSIHGVDYRIVDPEMAYVTPAKVLAMCAIDLLANRAERARAIVEQHKPALARELYTGILREQLACETHSYLG